MASSVGQRGRDTMSLARQQGELMSLVGQGGWEVVLAWSGAHPGGVTMMSSLDGYLDYLGGQQQKLCFSLIQ